MTELHAPVNHTLQPERRPFSGIAITAFIMSLLWLGGLGSLVGLFTSIAAMKETSDGRRTGQGLAVAALILSILGLISTVVAIIVIVQAGQQQMHSFNQISNSVGH